MEVEEAAVVANEPSLESVSLPTITIISSQQQQPQQPQRINSEATSHQSNHASQTADDADNETAPITIYLSDVEAQLIEALRTVAFRYNERQSKVFSTNQERSSSNNESATEQPPNTLTVRIAGGWVRDKILSSWSKSCTCSPHNASNSMNMIADSAVDAEAVSLGETIPDIDVTVNHISGVQFATLLQDYVKEQLQQTDGKVNLLTKCTSLGVIAANPAQSKHLETATLTIGGLSLDVCPLRGHELYSTESRIPTVTIGTAYQDALRRDFTVNALFYNCMTQRIEDWTRRGIHDLQQGRLVTPMPNPLTTFLDDPLRVLRAIRFAVRYTFDLDEALHHAAQQSQLHVALQHKVSRERVGKEVEGMLSGKNAQALLALHMIYTLGLASSVFCFPIVGVQCASIAGTLASQEYASCTSEDASMSLQTLAWDEASRILPLVRIVWDNHVAPTLSHPATTTTRTTTSADFRLLALASFVLPFRHVMATDMAKTNSAAAIKEWSVVSFFVRDSLKFKNVDVASMTTLMQMVDAVADFVSAAQHRDTSNTSHTDGNDSTDSVLDSSRYRLQAGLLVRQGKELWVTAFLLATVLLLHRDQAKATETTNVAVAKERHAVDTVDWIRASTDTIHRIVALGLDGCWKMRPLLDGKALIAALNLPKGPSVGLYMEEQVQWMLQHPHGSVDDCIRHLQSTNVVVAVPPPSNAKRGDKRKQNN